jgi:inner membrane protein
MDPVSQAVLGASAAQSGADARQMRVAAAVGILGGMAPDLDVLIRSPADPLLFLEYHRHFTHALLFIPVGSLLVAVLCHALFARRYLDFRKTWFYAALGYATHGVLDACTTYGTQLLWPFSDARIAWNLVSVIDPLFTLPVLALVLLSVLRRSRRAAVIALAWSIVYPLLGLVQRERAEAVGLEQALARGHAPVRLEAKPSFANILLWKVVYETEDRFHVDTVRAGFSPRFYAGESVPVLDVAAHFPWLSPDSQQARDIERFRWFSNGYIALHPRDPLQVIDMRYSMVPNEIEPLWTIRLDPRAGREAHVEYLASRDAGGDRLQRFREMLLGR